MQTTRPDSLEASVSVRELVEDPRLGLKVKLAAGLGGAESRISHNRVQRVGLALAGHFRGVVPHRLQFCGQTEMSYLQTLGPDRRFRVLDSYLGLKVCAVVVCCGFELPLEMAKVAERRLVPTVVVDEKTGPAIQAIQDYLDDRLAPRTQIHGVLVDVFGVGMLLLGKSGVGKSECALDLVLRGHRLVADDVVLCDYRPPGHIFGGPAGMLRHHIEVRGLGVLNIQTLFGVTSVRDRKRIDVVVNLCDPHDDAEADRLGIEDHFYPLLGVPIRELNIPVRAGRDMAAIIEIASRDELSRRAGHHSAKEFYDSLEKRLGMSPRGDSVDESIFFSRAQWEPPKQET